MSIFDSVQTPNPGYNKFDLSYTNTLTCNMSYMVPTLTEYLVPGDKFRGNSKIFARMMPMATPAFGNLRIITRYFFVPIRLLMPEKDWENFITGGTLNGTSTPIDYKTLFPKIRFHNPSVENLNLSWRPGTLADYLGVNFPNYDDYGINSDSSSDVYISQLPFRCYHKIYNDWYRDETIDPEQDFDSKIIINYDNSGNDKIPGFYTLHRARWHKDYFTSALITPTNGQQQMLPIMASDLSVYGTFLSDLYKPDEGYANISLGSDGNFYADINGQQQGPLNASTHEDSGLFADAQNTYMASIMDLRRSIATQRFLEISSRGGNRYIEQIFAHFGVRSLDSRLQRAEFLGGGITPVNIGEVLQTSASNIDGSETPLGEMAGRGVAYGTDASFNFTATEHGILMGITTIHPEAVYFQGINRHFQKFDRLDYYWPAFAHIGDQPINQSELYFSPNDSEGNDTIFGYAPRYAEYKYHPNEIHGVVKTNMFNWTFAQKYANAPKLNSEFIQVPNIRNPFADQTNSPKFILHIAHNISALRKMPYYGNPSLIG